MFSIFFLLLSVLTKAQIYIFIDEEIAINTTILNIPQVIQLSDTYSKRTSKHLVLESLDFPSGTSKIKYSKSFDETESRYSLKFDKGRYFTLEKISGNVKLAKRIDFEDPALFKSGCSNFNDVEPLINRPNMAQSAFCCIPLNISVEGGLNISHFINVCVNDINDNVPFWEMDLRGFKSLRTSSSDSKNFTIKITESSLINETFPLPSAIDIDTSNNGMLRYEMMPFMKEFKLNWSLNVPMNEENIIGSKTLLLQLQQPLDRERDQEYHFQLLAIDGGFKAKTGTLNIIVYIEDINDNSPAFKQKLFTVQLSEGIKPPLQIFQAYAVDADVGKNAEIEYSISSLTEPDSARFFSIDPRTGWINLERKLDFETQKFKTLTIEARDKGYPSRHSTCTLQVEVTDENDSAPKLMFEPGSLTNFGIVPENEDPGRIVAMFTVVDEDSDKYGQPTCLLSSVGMTLARKQHDTQFLVANQTEQNRLFKLEKMELPFATVYQLSTLATFDREYASKYRVEITCFDKGQPPLNTTGYVIVRIQDINDCSPRFVDAPYRFRISESQPINTTMFTINAIDFDEGENSSLTYSLTTNELDCLRINSRTGDVFLCQNVDHEKQNQINFIVTAEDGGKPSLKSSADVTVYINDENDNAPRITSMLFYSIFENHSAVKPVGMLNAADEDTGINGNFFFKIIAVKPCICGLIHMQKNAKFCSWTENVSGECDESIVDDDVRVCTEAAGHSSNQRTSKEYRRFLITEKGEIYLRYPDLDREFAPTYLIQGTVTDRGQPSKSTTFCATIVVKDINDCNPKFTFPIATNNSVIVRLPLERGDPIIQLHATDADAFENGELHFSLVDDIEMPAMDLFIVHPYSGLITSKRSLQADDFDGNSDSYNRNLKQTHHLRVKVNDLGNPPLTSYASLRIQFYTSSAVEQANLHLLPQDLKEIAHESRNEAMADSSPDVTWRTNMILLIVCAFFLILLLFLTVILLTVFSRHVWYPSMSPHREPSYFANPPCTVYVSPVRQSQSTLASTLRMTTGNDALLNALATKNNWRDSSNLSIDSSAV